MTLAQGDEIIRLLTIISERLPAIYAVATPAKVSVSTVSIELVPANGSRSGVVLFNQGPNSVYIKHGTGATTTDMTTVLFISGTYIVPDSYKGTIHGICDTAESADVNVTNP